MAKFRKGAIIGFAAGYYFGAKAGRERYEQIRKWSGRVKRSAAYKRAAGKVTAAVGLGLERGKLVAVDRFARAKEGSQDF